MMRHILVDKHRDKDPREALLGYAKESESDPQWVDLAYKSTQPKTIYDYNALRKDELKFLEESEKKKCAHCGLKLCTCKK